jgi:hypothetical protein
MSAKKNRLKSIGTNFLIGALIFSLYFIPLVFTPWLADHFQNRFLKGDKTLLLITGRYSAVLSGCCALLSFVMASLFYVNYKELRRKLQGKRSIIQSTPKSVIALAILAIISAGMVYSSSTLFCNRIEIFRNGIVSHNVFLLSAQTYSYDKIASIKIDWYSGFYLNEQEYILTMNDGCELNIAANGVYPHLFAAIDKTAPQIVTRSCTHDGRIHVIDHMPDTIRSYFLGRYSLGFHRRF